MIPKNREPTSPGEILREEFLLPLGMSQKDLAEKMSVPLQRVNEIINGKRGITADTAILLAEVFASSPEFWMNLQTTLDLYRALHARQRRTARPPARQRRAADRRQAGHKPGKISSKRSAP
jgi:addiction module HigA family antidote